MTSTTGFNDMSDLPKNSVTVALNEAAAIVGGWNILVGEMDTSRNGMRVWENNNEVPPTKARRLEKVTDGKVKRSRMNGVFT